MWPVLMRLDDSQALEQLHVRCVAQEIAPLVTLDSGL